MENKVPIRFFGITFLWTWLFFTPLVLLKMGIIPENNTFLLSLTTPMIVLAAFGPGIGACLSIYTINGKDNLKKYLKSFLSLNFGWKVWGLIFLIFGLVQIIAWIIPEFFGESRLSPFIPFYIFPPYLLLVIFFGGGQEEIGWRGYISPILERKYGIIFGSLMIGIIWAIWHIPLWFISGASQSYMPFGAFVLMATGYSYLFSWIVTLSKNKLLSGLIVHGVANSMMPLFPTLIMENDIFQLRFWIYCILIFIVGISIGIMRSIKAGKNCI
jgi:membrane protease YdiL (CAAX protease family)